MTGIAVGCQHRTDALLEELKIVGCADSLGQQGDGENGQHPHAVTFSSSDWARRTASRNSWSAFTYTPISLPRLIIRKPLRIQRTASSGDAGRKPAATLKCRQRS